MENKKEVIELVNNYLQEFHEEDQSRLTSFLNINNDLFDRKNFNGHITASAFIINPSRLQVLLIKHKLYDKYLQPGGHIESFDASILAAALREASEETGILQQALLYTKYNPSKNFPLDIDSHPIPPNKARDEPAHIHHDLRYLFIYKGNQEIKAPPAEAKAAQWISVAELQQQKMFATVAKKITTIGNRL